MLKLGLLSIRIEVRFVCISQTDSPLRCWKLVPSTSTQQSSGLCLSYASPLFEKEGDLRIEAPVANFFDPLFSHFTRAGTGLAASDYPMNALKWKMSKWADEWFTG